MTTARSERPGTRRRGLATVVLGVAVALLSVSASRGEAEAQNFCSRTAALQFEACRHERHDDRLTAKAICLNLADEDERADCFEEVAESRKESLQLCRDQRDARDALCDALGEDPYDPSFDPAEFDDDFANPAHLNPYLPLKTGNMWKFAAPAAGETNTVEVLSRTKRIEGVTCVVVRDLVKLDGVAKEFTDDWLAQAKSGDVIYCGEEVKDYEVFPGDAPQRPELVSIDGSFKVGRDGAKPGTFFFASPSVGTTYRQEYSIGNAEDVATVLSTSYSFGDDPELDEHVPKALADHLCHDDCIVTLESTPIEPDVTARKYYSPNIGVFLEVEGGEINRLIACNVDPRCATLPPP